MATPIWEGDRWRLRVNVNGKRRAFTSNKPGMAGKREVLRKARECESRGCITSGKVDKLWELFIEAYKDRHGECEQYFQITKIGNEHILPVIGFCNVQKMRYVDWQNVVSKAKPKSTRIKELSKKSLSNIRGVLNQFIKFCVVNDYMDPLKDSLYVPDGHPQEEKQILQPNEIKKLFEPNDYWYGNYFRFLVLTGMRPGEAMALKWSDVSDTGVVTIRRSINCNNRITEGKNKNARRQFILIAPARDVLADQRAKTNYLNSEWIFCSKSGGIASQKSARNQYNELTRDFASKTSPYCLRHTFISMLKNLPVELVKQVVGHSAAMDTFGTYGHVLDGEAEETARKIENTITSITG